ncbi:hypothetical protein BCIN_01g09200 [Botrytis cinerea B05.10]|uniref:Hydrophobin protein n=1 Tax=Botryotinia fuckeliana (strain B05.10) TaxID=332648 RepID=A0A384J6Q2_BOTFB|nr:hypothetical protein BCIN_01g09200 [Botrytis cinerea B05.10]ATZ46296.1 hypothetical protein BCIN_01g09200 [Botrytis cinerea B05.10]
MLLIAPILQVILFLSIASSLAVLSPAGSIGSKATAQDGTCVKQGGLCAQSSCCKNSGLACRPDGYGMHFCEHEEGSALPITRSTLDTFHEILRALGGRASTVLNTFALQSEHQEVDEGVGMKIEVSLRLGDETITARKTCSKAGLSCDFHKGEHCCSSLVCHTSRTSSISECRPPSDVKSEDEETLNVLRKPYLSLEQNLNSNSNTDESLEPKEEKKEEESKWDFLEAIKMPPRLDDITELPKCKPMNMKCNPISGIKVCCPDLDCMQVGPAYEDFECRQALEDLDEEEATASSYKEKIGSTSQWFLDGAKS